MIRQHYAPLGAATLCAAALFAAAATAQPVNPPATSDATMTPAAPAPDTSESAAAPAPATTVQVVTNGPIPDTAANRARYGGPKSHAGRRTKASGN